MTDFVVLALMMLVAMGTVVWFLRGSPPSRSVLPTVVAPSARVTPILPPPSGITDGLAVVLRGKSEVLTKACYTDGHSVRALQEVGRKPVSRQYAPQLREIGAGWVGVLHGLPAGTYRVQLINARHLTVASITVLWSERQTRNG